MCIVAIFFVYCSYICLYTVVIFVCVLQIYFLCPFVIVVYCSYFLFVLQLYFFSNLTSELPFYLYFYIALMLLHCSHIFIFCSYAYICKLHLYL